VLPENVEAFELWNLAGTQWRVSFGGVVGLDYTAVVQIADIYAIDLGDRLFDKLRIIERQVLLKQEDDSKREAVKDKHGSHKRH